MEDSANGGFGKWRIRQVEDSANEAIKEAKHHGGVARSFIMEDT
jgi:hypothetical protein